jgi:hypothetical protein
MPFARGVNNALWLNLRNLRNLRNLGNPSPLRVFSPQRPYASPQSYRKTTGCFCRSLLLYLKAPFTPSRNIQSVRIAVRREEHMVCIGLHYRSES